MEKELLEMKIVKLINISSTSNNCNFSSNAAFSPLVHLRGLQVKIIKFKIII